MSEEVVATTVVTPNFRKKVKPVVTGDLFEKFKELRNILDEAASEVPTVKASNCTSGQRYRKHLRDAKKLLRDVYILACVFDKQVKAEKKAAREAKKVSES